VPWRADESASLTPTHCRTAVVRISPNRAAVIRLVGMTLAEQDEGQDDRRYLLPKTMTAIDSVATEEVIQPLLLAV
jgi:hypothetical protein